MDRRTIHDNRTNLYTSVLPVLESLKNRYQLGVITNTIKEAAIKLLQDFEILEYFNIVIGGDEGRPKPAPDLINKACEQLNIQPSETLFIGDTLADIGAGKAAGCHTFIVSTSIPRDELEKVEEIKAIDDLKEILTTLGIN
jgi:HAD superfamily hydrolase (TIGR01509 family)